MLPLLWTTAYISLMKHLGQDHGVPWRWDGMKFSKAAITHHHKTVGVKTEEMYSLTVLEAKCTKFNCWEGHVLSKGSRGGSLLPLPGLWWWPAIFGIPWFVDASLQFLPPLSHGFVHVCLLCVSLSKVLSFVGVPVTAIGPILKKCDLILIFLLWQDSMHFQVSSHSQVLGLRTWACHFLGVGTVQPVGDENTAVLSQCLCWAKRDEKDDFCDCFSH